MGVEKGIDIDSFPQQYTAEESQMGGIGRKVEVCFNFQADKTIPGVIIRDDKEHPFRKIIRIYDGRTLLATECQYRAFPDVDETVVKQFSFMGSVNRLIESVKSGDRPSFTGFYLNESQLEELRPYVDNEYYNTVLKARLKPGKFIVCINGPRLSFLRSGEGDPPRTLLRNRAKIFPTRERAEMAIDKAKLTHPQKEREYFVDEL